MKIEEMKRALALEIPELILVKGDTYFWKDTNQFVTEREWDWIVRQSVGKMSIPDFRRFIIFLKADQQLTPRNAQFLSWQQRAHWYFEARGIKL